MVPQAAPPRTNETSMGVLAATEPVAGTTSASPSPVKELIVKGPPRPPPRSHAGMRAALWLGLLIGLGVAAVLVWSNATRRRKPAAILVPDKDEINLPPELEMREPTNVPKVPKRRAVREEPEEILADKL